MKSKKRMIITGVLFALVVFTVIFMAFRREEKVSCGTESNVIISRFPAINNIENCYYEAEIIGTVVCFAPTNYHLTAIVVVEEEEMETLMQQYEGEQVDIHIGTEMLDNVGLNDDIGWYFNQEFKEAVLGAAFIGEVYFSEENNAIYLEVENL